MNIVYFGNADFGLPTLDKLSLSDHNLTHIVTNEDQIKSSRGKSKSTPIKKWALKNDVSVIETDNLHDISFLQKLKSINADIFIVIAYKVIPKELYSIPIYGAMNLHASLLPKYRGAAPIQRALLSGDNKTGVSTFIINSGIDKGKIISQKSSSISINDNFMTLHDKLSSLGADIILESLENLYLRKKLIEQSGDPTYAKKIRKEELCISWNKPSFYIHNQIRAFAPFPGSYTFFEGNRVKILKSKYSQDKHSNINPGHIVYKDGKMFIGTIDNPLEIQSLKVEGKSEMTAPEFYNGYISSPKESKRFD